ncbi:beta-hydroxyacyl-ACP dehydratase [Micromonospora sp. WMMD1120]|uniref:3-hydroxyacyl-ACP dehydratase FabZ family protein n=1 Tax=Micromonospora sp. WMMD1120 TaxID=3016106 RepID=UPI002417CC3B|nr:beta-hydroxyacyl-ACP dehydratase [Micromonospora sp. WMMD1120]MDG4810835.1 beta-hydroxyacyl-ACP dehydratase [Micromonospora sp. WMMD1120]
MTPDYRWILDLIPVRHPIVLVDRVEHLEPDSHIVTAKAISGGDMCYQGLAEGLPAERYAFPRSLVVESFGQSAALLWLGSTALRAGAGHPVAPGELNWVPLAGSLRQCEFVGSAYPGEVIRHTVRLHEVIDDATAFMSGETTADGRPLFRVGQLTAVRRPRASITAGD